MENPGILIASLAWIIARGFIQMSILVNGCYTIGGARPPQTAEVRMMAEFIHIMVIWS